VSQKGAIPACGHCEWQNLDVKMGLAMLRTAAASCPKYCAQRVASSAKEVKRVAAKTTTQLESFLPFYRAFACPRATILQTHLIAMLYGIALRGVHRGDLAV